MKTIALPVDSAKTPNPRTAARDNVAGMLSPVVPVPKGALKPAIVVPMHATYAEHVKRSLHLQRTAAKESAEYLMKRRGPFANATPVVSNEETVARMSANSVGHASPFPRN